MSDADRCHRRGNVGHCVVNCEARRDGPARGVYVEGYGTRWSVGLKEEELRDDRGGGGVVDGAVETDDSFAEEAREDVICLQSVSGQRRVL